MAQPQHMAQHMAQRLMFHSCHTPAAQPQGGVPRAQAAPAARRCTRRAARRVRHPAERSAWRQVVQLHAVEQDEEALLARHRPHKAERRAARKRPAVPTKHQQLAVHPTRLSEALLRDEALAAVARRDAELVGVDISRIEPVLSPDLGAEADRSSRHVGVARELDRLHRLLARRVTRDAQQPQQLRAMRPKRAEEEARQWVGSRHVSRDAVVHDAARRRVRRERRRGR
mmetsp:Transcript_5732/g.17515  ORF Transcript_5732/g.17515 Transcript_5732/m.17515 type:complete len:228 (+) Transcript_5732:623-1306(+)